MKYTVIFVLITALLSSCEPSTRFSKIVKNDSSYPVKVLVDADTILVVPGTNTVVFYEEEMGFSDKYEDCYMSKHTMNLCLFDTTKQVHVDANNRENWYYSSMRKNNGKYHDCECLLLINDQLIY